MLTTNDVCELAHLAPTTLQHWIDEGLFVPVEVGGKGRGNSRKFTVQQAVGIAVAAALQRSPRGCSTAYIGHVVTAFGETTEDGLAKYIKAGATHFRMVTEVGGRLTLYMDGPHYPPGLPEAQRPQYGDLVNVQEVFRAVKALLSGKRESVKVSGK